MSMKLSDESKRKDSEGVLTWWRRRRAFTMSPRQRVDPSRFSLQIVQFGVDLPESRLVSPEFVLLLRR